jgi:hypothetical protein
MTTRTVQFLPDGARIRCAPAEVIVEWNARSAIDARYALGTAQHEADLTVNEVDTEPSGYISKGVYQLSDGEASDAGFPGADLLSLDASTKVFVELSARRLRAILAAWMTLAPKLNGLSPDGIPDDARAYLAVAHNAGLSTATKSITHYGMDWAAFVTRNAGTDWGRKIARYGSDCVSGGVYWPTGGTYRHDTRRSALGNLDPRHGLGRGAIHQAVAAAQCL